MSCNTLRLTVGALAALLLVSVCRPSSAGRKGIRAGDKVNVSIGPAPVKHRGVTVAEVPSGTILTALAVDGGRVKVAVETADGRVEGWVADIHLTPTRPRRDERPAAAPAPESGRPDTPARTPRAGPRFSWQDSNVIHAALRKECVPTTRDVKDAIRRSGHTRGLVFVGQQTTVQKYARLTLSISGRRVECVTAGNVAVGKYLKSRRRAARTSFRCTGVILLFPAAFRIGAKTFPPRTVLVRKRAGWYHVTKPTAWDTLLGRIRQAARGGDDESERAQKALALLATADGDHGREP